MQQAVLVGPCIGELYWEFGRFAPFVIWNRFKKYTDPSIKFIVLTREERFDIYNCCANILVPLKIEGDGTLYKQDCFRMLKYKLNDYKNVISTFRSQYETKFDIAEHIYPDLTKATRKEQFILKRMIFDKFTTRQDNQDIINSNIPNDKPLIVIAPRFRRGIKRNWPYWQNLFDLICDSDLFSNYYFVLCGKLPDHISDNKKRFFDINDFESKPNSSLIGLTMECLKRAILTIGSQSGIPNISLLFKTEVLEWGHERHLHTKTYNHFNTPVTFLNDHNYSIKPEIIVSNIKSILKRKGSYTNERKRMVKKK